MTNCHCIFAHIRRNFATAIICAQSTCSYRFKRLWSFSNVMLWHPRKNTRSFLVILCANHANSHHFKLCTEPWNSNNNRGKTRFGVRVPLNIEQIHIPNNPNHFGTRGERWTKKINDRNVWKCYLFTRSEVTIIMADRYYYYKLSLYMLWITAAPFVFLSLGNGEEPQNRKKRSVTNNKCAI